MKAVGLALALAVAETETLDDDGFVEAEVMSEVLTEETETLTDVIVADDSSVGTFDGATVDVPFVEAAAVELEEKEEAPVSEMAEMLLISDDALVATGVGTGEATTGLQAGGLACRMI